MSSQRPDRTDISLFFQGKADTANKGENGKQAKEELRSTVGSDATTRHAC